MSILPWPGIKSMSSAGKQILKHWITRGSPGNQVLMQNVKAIKKVDAFPLVVFCSQALYSLSNPFLDSTPSSLEHVTSLFLLWKCRLKYKQLPCEPCKSCYFYLFAINRMLFTLSLSCCFLNYIGLLSWILCLPLQIVSWCFLFSLCSVSWWAAL